MNHQLGIDITYKFFLLSLLFGYYKCRYSQDWAGGGLMLFVTS